MTSSQFAGSGTNAVSVTANLTGLSANTTYYDRVVGQNSAGTQRGSIASFTTGGLAPTVTTSAATSVMSTSATLNGNVNPNGTSTSAYFEWGTSSTLSTYSTTSAQSVGSGTSAASVSADLSGLSANTTYYYRVVGQNSAGTQRGTIVSFSTLAAGIAPTVTTGSPSNISTTSATLTGTVNPNGSSTSVVFQYGTSTSYGNQATATQSPVTGSSAVSVSALLTGLSSGTTYHYRVVATNSAGTSNGSDQTFISYSTSFAVSPNVSFPSKPKASDYSATDYRLVGLPGASDLSVGSLFSGTRNVDWQAYWDNGTVSNYLVEYDGSSTFRFTVGRAFWVISKGALNISRTVTAQSLNASQEAEIPLNAAWNLITNPFTSTIAWSKIQSANGINAPIYTFDGSFSTSSSFDPYVGYYFFNGSPNTTLTTLKVPYASIFSKSTEVKEFLPGDWRVSFHLTSGQI
ncbi:MAG: fibronectin type III domain-containing protein, partial [Bacteroidota bacterium]